MDKETTAKEEEGELNIKERLQLSLDLKVSLEQVEWFCKQLKQMVDKEILAFVKCNKEHFELNFITSVLDNLLIYNKRGNN